MIILPEQVLASAHIAENRWIPDLIFVQNAEKNCRNNLENKVHKKITKILALTIDKC